MNNENRVKEMNKIGVNIFTNWDSIDCFLTNEESRSYIYFCSLERDSKRGENLRMNEHYVIKYSEEFATQDIKIEKAYDIESEEILDLSNEKLHEGIKNMFFETREFHTSTVLQAINEKELEIVDDGEVEEFISYLTMENDDISNEEIKDYILSCYPKLRAYSNYLQEISVSKYNDVINQLGDTMIFKRMPQRLTHLYEKGKTKTK